MLIVVAACSKTDPTVAPPTPTPSPPPTPVAVDAAVPADAPPAAATPSVEMIDPGHEPRAIRTYAPVAKAWEITVVVDVQTKMAVDGADKGLSPKPATRAKLAVAPKADGWELSWKSGEVVDVPGAKPEIVAKRKAELAAMTGPLGTFAIDAHGAVTRVDLATTPDQTGGRAQFLEVLSSGGVMVPPFPVEPVGAGARWRTRRATDEHGVKGTETREYHLIAVDAGTATIEWTEDSAADPGQSFHPPGLPPETKATIDTATAKASGHTKVRFDRSLPTEVRYTNTSATKTTIETHVVTNAGTINLTVTSEK